MEDYIYIIILIAWVAYTFYRQSQKKKAAGTSPSREGKRADNPTVRSLEEILFGKETTPSYTNSREEDPEEIAWQTTVRDRPLSLEEMYMEPEIESMEKTPIVTAKNTPKTILPEEVPKEENRGRKHEGFLDDFDLRKAVIYAEILHRPYD